MNLLSLFATTDYSYSYSTSSADSALSAATVVLILVIAAVASIIAYALSSLFLSFIFKKAAVEKWKAWVPFYRMWILYELGGQAGWWVIVMQLPIAGFVALVFLYIAMYRIGLKLGKSGAFVLWAIFLPIVWYAWLAFDQSRWNPAAGDTVASTPTVPSTATI